MGKNAQRATMKEQFSGVEYRQSELRFNDYQSPIAFSYRKLNLWLSGVLHVFFICSNFLAARNLPHLSLVASVVKWMVPGDQCPFLYLWQVYVCITNCTKSEVDQLLSSNTTNRSCNLSTFCSMFNGKPNHHFNNLKGKQASYLWPGFSRSTLEGFLEFSNLIQTVKNNIPYRWQYPSSEHKSPRARRQGHSSSGWARTQLRR